MKSYSYRKFPTTRWSLVHLVQHADEKTRSDALSDLFSIYWYPMYAFVRRQGQKPEDSRDLVQQFFVKILENDILRSVDQQKGRFRAFIQTALIRFLKDEREKKNAQKRGGGWIAYDLVEAEKRFANHMVDRLTPESSYERDWAFAILQQALANLHDEYVPRMDQPVFERLRQFLPGESAREGYREVALALGISEAALKVRVHRMRQRCAQLIREEVAQTLLEEENLEDELKYLLHILCEYPYRQASSWSPPA